MDRRRHRPRRWSRKLAPDCRCLRYLTVDLRGLIGLVLLAAPHVVFHDLGVISEGTVVNAIFVFVPILAWTVVVIWARVPNACLTLLVIGIISGIFPAVGHQIFWTAQSDGQPPRLGGAMKDVIPAISSTVVRVFAVFSSIITGAVVGAAAGLVTWLLRLSFRRAGPQRRSDALSQE